ncbi:cyclic-di-AMP receptor [Levilactobacillus enshiensis]|uniref:cyclic-di-AMP receptor n=1 Tax=Levilactobacillus enshiensis TaxID=2590213 RepID=UPI00117B0641|nr:cyclic-di-AMP receptor [Levilactobacillus enshiensis]
MKLLIAIVQDKDANRLSNQFIDNDIRATRLSTTGGFLKSGNTTFMIGLEDERVDEVLDMIKAASHTRQQFMTPPVNFDAQLDSTSSYPVEVQVGGATVFVLPVDQFHRF